MLALIVSQDYRCALTGRQLEPDTASVDHKIPLSMGGPHDISNLWVLHTQINRAKGTMTIEEFIGMCREVVAHVDG